VKEEEENQFPVAFLVTEVTGGIELQAGLFM
jgi:hypothetical protein